MAEWLAEAKAEQEAADKLLPGLRAAQTKWFTERLETTKDRIQKATSPSAALWPPKNSELKTLHSAGIDTSAFDALMVEWESVILPALKEQEANSKRLTEERKERKRAEAEAAEAQAEADKLAWCAVHGSPHLAQAVAAGYDCTRLYATERADSEHPGYVLDYRNNAEWKGRSCPTPKALTEALAVRGEVVWLTEAPRTENPDPEDYWDDSETYPCEAVVIRGFLGRYDLIRAI